MSMLSEWKNILGHFSRHRRFDADLDDEIRFHLETRAAELQASGLSRSDALTQSRREFGSVARASEESRGAWQILWLEDLVSDLRHTLRAFRGNPAFALTAVLSLALGIGGTTAIYTALEAVLWKPLPVEDPNSLVTLSISRDKRVVETDLPAAFVSRLRTSRIFAGLAVNTGDGLSFSYDGRAERIVGESVASDFFDVLGVPAILGQNFTPDVRGGRWAAEAVLSYDFWQRRFGGDPTVIGRTIRLNTYPFTIVGVTPRSFFGLTRGTNYELRIPILPEGQEIAQINQISGKPEQWFGVVARLKRGITVAQSQAAADAEFQEFLRTTPPQRLRIARLGHLRISPFARGYDEYVLPFYAPLLLLLILVSILLVIACSNVATMLLARAAARAREFAVRISIGAGRLRLIRQLLAESILLSFLGGGLGVAVAYWAGDVLFHFLPQGHISIAIDLRPDTRALLFTLTLSLVTGLVFGLAPALEATRGCLAIALKTDTASAPSDGRGTRIRKILVASQVAFSLVLLIAAGIFARTLSDLRPADFRCNPDHILLFTLKPQPEIYSNERKLGLTAELIRRVSALPGVEAAALAESGPLGSRLESEEVQVPGHDTFRAGSDRVTPGFFDSVGIPRIAGRDFDARDKPGSPLVVIINQALARSLFPNQNPVGRTLRIPSGKQDGDYVIVGVVADARYYDVHKKPQPFLWLSMGQNAPYMPTLHVRTNTPDTATTIAEVRREFDLLDKGFPVFNVRTMAARIEDSLASERMVANLSGAFGVLALVLAAVGLYGVLAYSVSRRNREIGIRMALGAKSGEVLWLVAREAFALVGAGSVAGLVFAIAASRLLIHYVAGVSSIDPAIITSCIFGMLVVAAAAVSLPAIRGCRVDPVAALRHDG